MLNQKQPGRLNTHRLTNVQRRNLALDSQGTISCYSSGLVGLCQGCLKASQASMCSHAETTYQTLRWTVQTFAVYLVTLVLDAYVVPQFNNLQFCKTIFTLFLVALNRILDMCKTQKKNIELAEAAHFWDINQICRVKKKLHFKQ